MKRDIVLILTGVITGYLISTFEPLMAQADPSSPLTLGELHEAISNCSVYVDVYVDVEVEVEGGYGTGSGDGYGEGHIDC